jgi:hypothetical protein
MAPKLIEAAQKKGADPAFREMVFDSVRRYKEGKEDERFWKTPKPRRRRDRL